MILLFFIFIVVFVVLDIYIEKTVSEGGGSVGVGVRGSGLGVLPKNHKNHKEISQVLDFQRFGVLWCFCGGFVVLCHFAKNML